MLNSTQKKNRSRKNRDKDVKALYKLMKDAVHKKKGKLKEQNQCKTRK